MTSSTYAQRSNALLELGVFLRKFCDAWPHPSDTELAQLIRIQHQYHPWHTEQSVIDEMSHWAQRLTELSLRPFAQPFENTAFKTGSVVVLPAHEVPLAGFHELICIWLAGGTFVCRNEHSALMQSLGNILCQRVPSMCDRLLWPDGPTKDADRYIVHFHAAENVTLKQYFAKRISLLIEKRISVAIIHQHDNRDTFRSLGYDVFHTFGQSPYCVRKLLVPSGFVFDPFFEEIEPFAQVYSHNRYANNYDYHRSILLMDRKPFLDNGFLIIRESDNFATPIGCLYFQTYSSAAELENILQSNQNSIQQIISSIQMAENWVLPGHAHHFALHNYIDKQDVMKFLQT